MTVQNYLAGRWVEGDAVLPVENPATGNVYAEAPPAGEATMALDAARAGAILHAAANTVTPAQVELGGKSAAVVYDDADVAAVLASVRSGIFFNAGQVCSAMARLLVHRSLHDRTVLGVLVEGRWPTR